MIERTYKAILNSGITNASGTKILISPELRNKEYPKWIGVTPGTTYNFTVKNVSGSTMSPCYFIFTLYFYVNGSYIKIQDDIYNPYPNNSLANNQEYTVSFETVYWTMDITNPTNYKGAKLYIEFNAKKDVWDNSEKYPDGSLLLLTDYSFILKTEEEESTLIVTNGIGSGIYASDNLVQIVANAPSSGKVFSEWQGASGLKFFSGNAYTPSALFYMPSDDITLTATYVDRSSVVSSGRYTGSAYQQVIPLHYDGTNWKECIVKRYDGTNWKDVDLT